MIEPSSRTACSLRSQIMTDKLTALRRTLDSTPARAVRGKFDGGRRSGDAPDTRDRRFWFSA